MTLLSDHLEGRIGPKQLLKLKTYLESQYQEMLKYVDLDVEAEKLSPDSDRFHELHELPLALDFLLEELGVEGHFGS